MGGCADRRAGVAPKLSTLVEVEWVIVRCRCKRRVRGGLAETWRETENWDGRCTTLHNAALSLLFGTLYILQKEGKTRRGSSPDFTGRGGEVYLAAL